MKRPFFYLLALVLTVSVVSCKKDKGEAASTTEAGTVNKVESAATYKVNAAASKVMWEGYKPTGTHNGTINVTEGTVDIKDGKLAAGKFVMDMNSITSLDLTGDNKASLESHLKGMEDAKADDFFNVRQYPTSTFEITKVVDLAGDSEANSMVYGNLTIKDQTQQIGFKANVMMNGDAVEVSTPKFNIDRTKWNVKYGSKSIFDNLGDKFINDEIGLTIALSANK
jgi:polyisoprenoid-binding protein YceI